MQIRKDAAQSGSRSKAEYAVEARFRFMGWFGVFAVGRVQEAAMDWAEVADAERVRRARHKESLLRGGRIDALIKYNLPGLFSAIAERIGRELAKLPPDTVEIAFQIEGQVGTVTKHTYRPATLRIGLPSPKPGRSDAELKCETRGYNYENELVTTKRSYRITMAQSDGSYIFKRLNEHGGDDSKVDDLDELVDDILRPFAEYIASDL